MPHHSATGEPGAGRPARGPITAWAALAACLALPVAAVWSVAGFVTQDGPAHLYNAHVLAESLRADSPFRWAFEVRWEPLPNWAGHLTLAALVAAFPPRLADRLMTTLTLVGFAAAVFHLRRRTADDRGGLAAAALAALFALNVTWLLGFTSFVLGACLFPLTLQAWWRGRGGGWSPARAAALAGLVVLGYFCHLVSLGLTAFGLVVLEALTPGPSRKGRALTTALGLLPLGPLGLVYLRLMKRGGGGLAPEWKHLDGLFSPRGWVNQLTWVDPVSLARKDYLPALGAGPAWHNLFAPAVLLGAGLAAYLAAAARAGSGPRREGRGWWCLAALLLTGGVLGPDTLGANHGEYLQQRIVLLGLVALVPVLPLEPAARRLPRLGLGLVAAALAVQTAVVWDYARHSDHTAGAVLKAGPALGTGKRLATLLIDTRTPFRANPLLHADCALGVGTGCVVWGDYETRFYYFPVQFRPGLDRPDPLTLERIALSRDPDERHRLWAETLRDHDAAIDAVVVWGHQPDLDALNGPAYATSYRKGSVTILEKRPPER